MKPFYAHVLLMGAAALLCAAAVESRGSEPQAMHRVAAYAPEVTSGIVYDAWLDESHGGFFGDGQTLIRFDVTDPSVFDGFSPPPVEIQAVVESDNKSTFCSVVVFSTDDGELPDTQTAYWTLDTHGPDSDPLNNFSLGLYYPDIQKFYWYECDT